MPEALNEAGETWDDDYGDSYRMNWLEENLARIQEMPVKVNNERRYGFWCSGKLLFVNSTLRHCIDLARDHETPPPKGSSGAVKKEVI